MLLRSVLAAALGSSLLAQAPPEPIVPPADAQLAPSGLAHRVLRAGTGTETPRSDRYLTFHFRAWDAQGKVFGDTWKSDPPRMPMDNLMKGMKEALLHMKVGELRRLWIPEALAFAGQAGRPKGAVLMDLELLDIEPPPTEAPPDVMAPPPDAVVLRSGLATKVLRPGTGTRKPTARNQVEVHYTGWTTDGKMFDSSLLRRVPTNFRVDEVIKGWTEGLQLMVVGERRRFWIPEKLAYKGDKGMPAGMLVFDVELVSINR